MTGTAQEGNVRGPLNAGDDSPVAAAELVCAGGASPQDPEAVAEPVRDPEVAQEVPPTPLATHDEQPHDPPRQEPTPADDGCPADDDDGAVPQRVAPLPTGQHAISKRMKERSHCNAHACMHACRQVHASPPPSGHGCMHCLAMIEVDGAVTI